MQRYVLFELNAKIGTIPTNNFTPSFGKRDVTEELGNLPYVNFCKESNGKSSSWVAYTVLNEYDLLAIIYKFIYRKLVKLNVPVRFQIEEFFKNNTDKLKVLLDRPTQIFLKDYVSETPEPKEIEQELSTDVLELRKEVRELKIILDAREKDLIKAKQDIGDWQRIAEKNLNEAVEAQKQVDELKVRVKELESHVDPEYLQYLELSKKFGGK